MATTAKVPLEVYLRTKYEPDADYVDGVIEERATGEFIHSSWCGAILFWFFRNEDSWNVQALPVLSLQTSPTRIRVADVAILDDSSPREEIPTHPPVAVFEVLSSDEAIERVLRKLADYAAMGVPEIWSVDPRTGIFSRLEDGQLVQRERFRIASKGIDFATGEIAELVD